MKFKFKDYADYKAQREKMLNEARTALKNGDNEKCNELSNNIKEMDKAWDKFATNKSNIATLEGSAVPQMQLANLATPENANIGTLGNSNHDKKLKAQQQEIYKEAFANVMRGRKLDDEQKKVFDDINARFQNSDTLNTVSSNAVLVPETVKKGIWQEMGEQHPIISDMFATSIKGNVTITTEKIDGADAEWGDEADETPSDEVKFGEVNLTGCDLSKCITISWKLKEMSTDDFLTYISQKIGKKLGNAIANGIVNGKGKPGDSDSFKAQPRGIVTAVKAEESTPQVVQYDSTNGASYKDMTSLLSKVKSGYKKIIYAKSATVWTVLANITDTTGRPYFIPDTTKGGVGVAFGAIVKEEDAVSENCILIGDIAEGYAANKNKDITMYQEDHVKQRKTDYMGYMIFDGDILTTKAFAYMEPKTA
ncbi:phage major capsid protein [Clostridium sp. BJN0001]|uniref:phage major capsid protein n=1 Tax=Clostridium sp. BJN0001 TaxID=2930219 RepID=UPI001FD00646|nr:phage major capsid protein [Clostridium sp. BJN0001]